MSDIKVSESGYMVPIEPGNRRTYTLKELQDLVGGRIEVVPTGTGKYIILNKDGEIKGCRPNGMGTLWLTEAGVHDIAHGIVLLIDDGRIEYENY